MWHHNRSNFAPKVFRSIDKFQEILSNYLSVTAMRFSFTTKEKWFKKSSCFQELRDWILLLCLSHEHTQFSKDIKILLEGNVLLFSKDSISKYFNFKQKLLHGINPRII